MADEFTSHRRLRSFYVKHTERWAARARWARESGELQQFLSSDTATLVRMREHRAAHMRRRVDVIVVRFSRHLSCSTYAAAPAPNWISAADLMHNDAPVVKVGVQQIRPD